MTATIATELEFAQKLGELFGMPLVACQLSGDRNEFHYPTGERDALAQTTTTTS
jgi:hypothetical protein